MTERGDWHADTEGNLTAPGGSDGDGVKPPTDEFGRDDPESLERERRRQEREARRSKRRKSKPAKEPATEPEAAASAPKRTARAPKAAARAPVETAPAPPTEAQDAPELRRPRRSMRERFGRDGGDPRPPRQRGAYWRRRFLALGLVLVAVLGAWFLISLFQPGPFDPGDGEGTVAVTIPEGATASDIADILTDNDVVSNGTLFKWRLQLAGKSGSVQASRYVLAHDMSYGAAIDRLTSSGGKATITIPEGEDRTQIAATVKDLGFTGDYLAASKSVKGFDPNRFGATNPKSLEGFLFPATYELSAGASVNQLVSEQLAAFQQNIGGVNLSYAKSKNLTVYDVLTIASMIDKEVQIPSERPLVSAVIYNRLSRGMPLGIDATTRFQFHNYTGDITQSQLSSPSPYNTRINAGLPPTPIGNPGLDAIKAAARPAKTNYLFYVLKAGGDGNHCFAATEAEFNELVTAYQQGKAPANCQS